MRRIVLKIVQAQELGDTSALRNPSSLISLETAVRAVQTPRGTEARRNSDAVIQELNAAIMQVIGTLINSQVPLMQAGLTSLGALKLGRSLQNRLSLDVPATLVFDHPSL